MKDGVMKKSEVAGFGPEDVELLSRETLYRGFFHMEKIEYRYRKFLGGWSLPVTREVLYRGGAVGVLLYDPEHDLVGLVEQIRPGAMNEPNGPWCLEVVAGMIEGGESVDDVAWRELKEESGLVPVSIEYICRYLPSPGGCDESMHLYCGLVGLNGLDGEVHGLEEENEDIRLTVIPANQVFSSLYSGRFNNAATLISLQWLQLNHKRLRGEVI